MEADSVSASEPLPRDRDLEEGECSSSDDENFSSDPRDGGTSLVKPTSTFQSSDTINMMQSNPRIPQIVINSDDDDDDDEDDYDSDESDYPSACKKVSKMSDTDRFTSSFPSQPVFVNPLTSKANLATEPVTSHKTRRKNNIWGSVLAEQTLSQDIKLFSVEEANVSIRCRDVESYDYTIAKDDDRPFIKPENVADEAKGDVFDCVVDLEKEVRMHESRKRKRPVKERLGSRKVESTKSNFQTISGNNEIPEVVRTIIDALEEPNIDLFHRIVESVGNEMALKLLRKTEDVESAGGLMVHNGTRRRTPGGVFIQLLKSEPDIPSEVLDVLFKEQQEKWIGKMKEKRKMKRAKRRHCKSQAKNPQKLYMDVDRPETPVPSEDFVEVSPSDGMVDHDVTDLPERPATPEPKDDSSDGGFDDDNENDEDISVAIAKAKAAILKKQRELCGNFQTEVEAECSDDKMEKT